MRMWSFYDKKTGLFTGRTYGGLTKALEANTPEGCKAIEGRWSRHRCRVDLKTGDVVEYRPPPPDDLHEWDEDRGRYVLKLEEDIRRRRHRTALARISELEEQQARPLRELAINADNQDARRRVESIEAEIASLRADIIEDFPDAHL